MANNPHPLACLLASVRFGDRQMHQGAPVMSYIDWHVGMKVVAVSGAVGRKTVDGEAKLKPGQIFTIRELVPYGDTFHIRLVEVVNPQRLYRWPDGDRIDEMVYLKESFRPLATRKTSIEIFERLLTPSEDDKAEIELLDYEIVAVPFQ